MADSSTTPPALSNSTVLEVSSKIMISAVIILFIVIAFVVILQCYARLSWSDYSEDPSILSWRRQQAAATAAQRRRQGIDSSTLDSLPIVVFNPRDFKDGLECTVCLCELQQGEKARILPKCKHGFHADCIDMWFQSHSTCPVCREKVVLDSSTVMQVEMPLSEEGEGDSQPVLESPAAGFPTNVLFWGDETQVRSLELTSSSSPSSSSSPKEDNSSASTSGAAANNESGNSKLGGNNEMLVVEIPALCESCSHLSTPPLSARLVADQDDEAARSPMATGLRSLKRLLSRGKRIAPSPTTSAPSTGASGSGSGDVV